MPKLVNQFVCEHLENISRTALERFQDIVRDYVRRRQGVYALYKGPKLYYVGLASNLRSRLTAHLNDRHAGSWDRFSVYLTKSDTRLRELEALLLRIVRPKGNRQIGRFGTATDLRQKFACDIRQAHREEYQSVIGKPRRGSAKVVRGGAKVTGGRPAVLAAYEKRSKKLRARFKGSLLRATVRKDGRISFAGSLYDSPSLAAAAACGRKTCNGWKFWQYERAPGDWVLLDELRR